ncbi:MAG TPA: hypothetical protein VIK89_02645 [Cytophagaceae bacterium]
MNTLTKLFGVVLLGAFQLIICQYVHAQDLKQAGGYMNFISHEYRGIMENYMSYTSAVAHGKSARKVDNKRQALLKSVKEVTQKVSSMPAFEGDKSLRDSTVTFLKITYHILTDDYGKIIDLEEIAEQSYDAMEAYYLAQDAAGEKLEEAHQRLKETEKKFAEAHNVNLITNDDELSKKLEIASKVNKYHRTIYLIFFKSYKQEAYLLEAINNKNINSIEQNKNTLASFAQEGLDKLAKQSAYNGDNSLIAACKQLLEFHKAACKDKINIMTNYYLKEENFNKIKKAFDTKKESERTQADVDEYNKAVNELNKAVEEFNSTNIALNDSRNKIIDNWNKTSQSFLNKHTPKHK